MAGRFEGTVESEETQHSITEAVRVIRSVIDSNIHGMVTIEKDKVAHVLPQKRMIDISC